MTNILIALVLIVAGTVLGFHLRYLGQQIEDLKEMFEEEPPATGPTLGVYKDLTAPNVPTVRVVTPKTPQRIAWEAQQRQLDEARSSKLPPMGPE